MEMKKMQAISIAVVTYNNESVLGRSVASLSEFWPDTLDCRVYAIDNASTDNTIAQWKTIENCVTFLPSDRGNIGFGAAHNRVIPYLESDVHIIMNPDINLLDNKAIPILCRYLEDHPEVGMVVPRIVDAKGELQYLCRRNPTVIDLAIRFLPGNFFGKRKNFHVMKDMDYGTSFEVPFASGCFMVIRTSLFRELGGFDDRYFMYVEDADLTRRVNQTNKTVYVPEATVCHAWERASYKNIHMTRIHLKSLWKYFRKWGFKFT
jgi:GT2 family glycosyltransferase